MGGWTYFSWISSVAIQLWRNLGGGKFENITQLAWYFRRRTRFA
jgi:hypothetical protein